LMSTVTGDATLDMGQGPPGSEHTRGAPRRKRLRRPELPDVML